MIRPQQCFNIQSYYYYDMIQLYKATSIPVRLTEHNSIPFSCFRFLPAVEVVVSSNSFFDLTESTINHVFQLNDKSSKNYNSTVCYWTRRLRQERDHPEWDILVNCLSDQ